MSCNKCGSNNVFVQAVAEQKKRGCLATVAWITLTIFTCGLLIIIPLIMKKGSRTVTWATCQSCGNRWKA